MPRARGTILSLSEALGVLLGAGLIGGFALACRAVPSPLVRVNQVGYQPVEVKRAVLMSTNALSGTFSVISNDTPVYSASIPATNAGTWTTAYTNTYLLDFSSITNPGVYEIHVAASVNATSPPVTIAMAPALYRPLLTNALFYFQSSRDGPNVITNVISRMPSHTNDEAAGIYLPPKYNSSDNLVGTLTNVGGPIDVSGGWFDAGDYIKLVETTSYVEGMMLTAMRDYPNLLSASVDFRAESRFGLDWLLKMWDQTNKVLYYAVAIGNGNGSTILGDHDFWRLPEADDALSVTTKSNNYYLKYRPAFRAGTNGASISPNLAGRMAASFALASQVYRVTDPAFADSCLLQAQTVFGLAKTNWSGNLLTAPPYDFYPETVWKDDIEWGAAELYFATTQTTNLAGLPQTNALWYLTNSAYWASNYIADNNIDGLNLYDTGMLAHYELYRAMTQAGISSGLAVTKASLSNSMNGVLSGAASQAGKNPFGLAQSYGGLDDPVPHVLCYVITADFFKQLTGSTNYDSFAQKERDWVFGKNPWGTTFIVGAGTTFPHCMQDQIANLAGHLDGTPPQRYGATVDGPNNSLSGNGTLDGMNSCDLSGEFSVFDGKGAFIRDGAAYWMTVEPAQDYTVPTVLLYAQEMGELTTPSLQSPGFSVDGNFQSTLMGSTGFLYIVQSSTDLFNWSPLQTNTIPFRFTDSNAAGLDSRFYRALLTY